MKAKIAPPHEEARRAGVLDGWAGMRRRAGEWPSGTYGHADYELGYAESESHIPHSWCWCGPYQDGDEPAVWIHREKPRQ